MHFDTDVGVGRGPWPVQKMLFGISRHRKGGKSLVIILQGSNPPLPLAELAKLNSNAVEQTLLICRKGVSLGKKSSGP